MVVDVPHGYEVGTMVEVPMAEGSPRYGVIKWIGYLPQMKNKLVVGLELVRWGVSKYMTTDIHISWRFETSFSIFHNNIISLNHNLEKLQTNYLTKMDFKFDIIGLTETKITKTTCNVSFEIPGYFFEYVTTPLASGGVALFINEDLNYTVLERVSCEAFQALWIEICHEKQKKCYMLHNLSSTQFP